MSQAGSFAGSAVGGGGKFIWTLVLGFGNTVHFVLSGINKVVVYIFIQTVEMEVLLFWCCWS